MPTDLVSFGAAGAVVAVVVLFLKFMREEGANRDKTYLKMSDALEGVSRAVNKNSTILQKQLDATRKIPPTLNKIADRQAKELSNNGSQ